MNIRTDDLRIRDIRELTTPEELMREHPVHRADLRHREQPRRRAVHRILHGQDDRLAVVIGPCSIHDIDSAMEYARRLAEQRERLKDALEIVMRVYFEKPRTTVGWKGLINDPDLDGSFRINEGLRLARGLLLDINELGLPAGCEFLDMITPQYIADLVALGRDRRAHHREPGASRARLRPVLPGRLQERHRRQRQDRRRCRAGGGAAAPFPGGHQAGAHAPSPPPPATPTATSSCAAARLPTTTPRASLRRGRRSPPPGCRPA